MVQKITSFKEIEKYPCINYIIDIPFELIYVNIQKYISERNLNLTPDFQRHHCWNNEQRSAFIEHVLRGGGKEKLILLNENDEEFVLIDGLQRLTAIQLFIQNKICAFGSFYEEFDFISGCIKIPNTTNFRRIKVPITTGIKLGILNLRSRAEVLSWYINYNACGVNHTEEELNKVRQMLSDLSRA